MVLNDVVERRLFGTFVPLDTESFPTLFLYFDFIVIWQNWIGFQREAVGDVQFYVGVALQGLQCDRVQPRGPRGVV